MKGGHKVCSNQTEAKPFNTRLVGPMKYLVLYHTTVTGSHSLLTYHSLWHVLPHGAAGMIRIMYD